MILNEIPNFLISIQWSVEVPKKFQGDVSKTPWNVATFLSKSQFLKGKPGPAPHDFTVPGIQRSCFHHTFVKWEMFFMKAAGGSHVKLLGKTHQLQGFGADLEILRRFLHLLLIMGLYSKLQPNKQTAWKSPYLTLEPQRTIFLMDGNGDFQTFPM